MTKNVWLKVVEVCDVVIGINMYEESRVAKGLPSLLGFECRSNGISTLLHADLHLSTIKHLLRMLPYPCKSSVFWLL
jgi:hypothetical protein